MWIDQGGEEYIIWISQGGYIHDKLRGVYDKLRGVSYGYARERG